MALLAHSKHPWLNVSVKHRSVDFYLAVNCRKLITLGEMKCVMLKGPVIANVQSVLAQTLGQHQLGDDLHVLSYDKMSVPNELPQLQRGGGGGGGRIALRQFDHILRCNSKTTGAIHFIFAQLKENRATERLSQHTGHPDGHAAKFLRPPQ